VDKGDTMSWNHRVMKHHDCGETWYGIHEVFYDEEGKVENCTYDADITGESLEDLKRTLEWMLVCLDKPVLDYEDVV